METFTMHWGQVITIIITILGPMMGFFFWLRKDIKDDIKDLKVDIKSVDTKIDDIRDRVSRVEGQEDYSRNAIFELFKRQDKGKT